MVGGEPAPGEVFGSYRVEGVLGRGGMAIVVLVRHVDLGTLHALKIPQIVGGGLLERFMQEGRLQAHLRHPNIVAVTDVVRIGPLPGLVMEYVRGPNLRGLLDRYQPNLQQIDQIADQMMGAVEAAHSRQVVHRDLKPENVLLSTEGGEVLIKVSDFGLAKVMEDFLGQGRQHPTRSGQTMGTPAYMAPEQQSQASRVDHRADIFSLGAVLYELVSGVPAFTGPTIVEVFSRSAAGMYRPLHEIAPSAPERFGRAVRLALQPDRDLRPQSVAELRELWRDGTERASGAWEPSHVSLLRTLAPGPEPGVRTATISAPPAAPPPAAPPQDPSSQDSSSQDSSPSLGETVFGALTAPPEATEAPRSRWAMVAGMGVGVGLFLAIALGSWSRRAEPLESQPARAAPIATPDRPTAPAPVEVTAPAEPAPSPKRPPKEPTRTATPEPTPASPEVAPPEVAPPEVAPPVDAPPQGSARVAISGVRRAWLVRSDGERVQPDTWVPPGDYKLMVWFDEDNPTAALEFQLQAGEVRAIACNRSLKVCR